MKLGILGRGVIAGLLGGLSIAVWFLIVDSAQGVPFRTPALVANGLMGRGGTEVGVGLIASYTFIHFFAFGAIGIGVAWVISKFPVSPGAVMGVVLGFLLFDLLFYGSVVVTGVDIVNELGWLEVLAGNVIAGLVLMKALHGMGGSKSAQWLHALDDHETTREGLTAGFIGAIAVAAWFLLFDTIQEVPFFTPGALGSALFLGASSMAEVQVNPLTVLGYTVVHFVAFGCTGLLAALLLRQAEETPPILLAGLVLFVVFEALFLGLMAIVAQFLMGPLAWWSIAGGNLVATLFMGAFLWRRHRGLLRELDSQYLLEQDEPRRDPARAA